MSDERYFATPLRPNEETVPLESNRVLRVKIQSLEKRINQLTSLMQILQDQVGALQEQVDTTP